MGVSCFICDSKLFGERTRVCSSITPRSNVPYPEKIAELMGDEFVIIVTPADHMCKKCTSLLTHMDKLESDLKLVKTAMLSYIQKKYGILPADQPVKTLDVVNGVLKTDELEVGQRKVPSGLTNRDNSVNSVNSQLKMMRTPQDNSSKMKIYKCGFCTFQSKELGHVRFHMRSHMNKKGDENTNQTLTKTLTQAPQQQQQQQQKKRLYRCQVCSTSFDSRVDCLEHIQKDHNQQTIATSNELKETEDVPPEPKILKREVLKVVDISQQAVANADVEDGQQEKGCMDTDTLLNDNVPVEGSAACEQEEETQNTEGEVPAQEESMQIDQGISENVETKVEDMAIGSEENKTEDLDIESMLAAIHNDTPTTDGSNTQNID